MPVIEGILEMLYTDPGTAAAMSATLSVSVESPTDEPIDLTTGLVFTDPAVDVRPVIESHLTNVHGLTGIARVGTPRAGAVAEWTATTPDGVAAAVVDWAQFPLRQDGVDWGITFAGETATGGMTEGSGAGFESVEMGIGARAAGKQSVAIGANATAAEAAAGSTAVGYEADASGQYAVAIGENSAATGVSSLALGARVTVAGSESVGIGATTVIDDTSPASVALGYEVSITGSLRAQAIGANTIAQAAPMAVVIGYATEALSSQASTVVGALSWADASDRAAVVGTLARAVSSVGAIAIGDGARAESSPNALAAGRGGNAISSDSAIVMGKSASANTSVEAVVIGSVAKSLNNIAGIALGASAQVLAGSNYSWALGAMATVPENTPFRGVIRANRIDVDRAVTSLGGSTVIGLMSPDNTRAIIQAENDDTISVNGVGTYSKAAVDALLPIGQSMTNGANFNPNTSTTALGTLYSNFTLAGSTSLTFLFGALPAGSTWDVTVQAWGTVYRSVTTGGVYFGVGEGTNGTFVLGRNYNQTGGVTLNSVRTFAGVGPAFAFDVKYAGQGTAGTTYLVTYGALVTITRRS